MDHVFYRQLRSKPIDLSAFVTCLGKLSKELGSVVKAVPAKWNNSALDKIDQHLRTVASHAQEFGQEIRRALA